ncbi:MAG TPA: hypothetical protein VGB42_11335 [Candidatus Thermoplasmatota archaeon]
MLEWHEAPEGLGRAVAGPFRLSREGTRKRREARAAGAAGATALTGLLVIAGFAEAAWPGAAVGMAGAGALVWALRRVERAYFTRIVPTLEVHEKGLCFCDTRRPVHFEELSGVLFGSGSLFLAFRRGIDAERDTHGARFPLWERGVRRKAYWEVPLDGFADAEAVVEAVTSASGLPTRRVTDDVLAALQSRTAQGIARVPAAPVEFRF